MKQAHILSCLLLIILTAFFILGTQIPITNLIPKEEQPSTSMLADNNIKNAGALRRQLLPDFSHIQDTQEKKQQFFGYLIPIITEVNINIMKERQHIIELKDKSTLSNNDKADLSRMAKKYRVKKSAGDDAVLFNMLLIKVDRIPPSLVLAQAANESAWGTSRFAIKGNNLFGQWCFSKGCGLVPIQRNDNAIHEVAKFDSVFNSVESYMLNLNRHAEYNELRAIRQQAREENQIVSGLKLANGLKGYSERGQDYVKEIQSMIRFNNLSSLDSKNQ